MKKKSTKPKKPKKKKEWTLHGALQKPLRKAWLYSPVRRAAVMANSLGSFKFFPKDDPTKKPQYAQINHCEECNRITPSPDVDHIIPVGSLKDDFYGAIDRMFFPKGGLRILCKRCHKAITASASASE